MNFLYYKNFGDDKSSASTHLAYKKKKNEPRKSGKSGGGHGREGHHANCDCEVCSGDYHLRTHLLLDMSYSRLDSSHTTSRKSTRVSSMFSFFGFGKKVSQSAGREEMRPSVRVTFAEPQEEDVEPTVPLDPVNLSALKEDCIMIPIQKLKNFFPAGHPVIRSLIKLATCTSCRKVEQVPNKVETVETPCEREPVTIPKGDRQRLRMIETNEPDVKMLFHMLGPAAAFLPSLSSTLIDLHTFQKDCIVKAFKSTVATINIGSALQGMVLLNLEKGGELGAVEYPFMIVWVIDSRKCDVKNVAAKIKQYTLESLDPGKTGFTSTQYLATFEEVASLARPPLEKLYRRASTPSTGYIILVFKVFEGDDGQKFERNWLGWSGARALYSSMTKDVGLRRLTLHKSAAYKGFHHYILLCDCANFLPHLDSAVKIVPKLRMRLCGDTGLYRPICTV